MRVLSIALILCWAISCSKIKYYPDKPVSAERLKFVHRGGASKLYKENSLEGCIASLKIADGVEVDVQLSKDRTVWLNHDPKVNECNTNARCFSEITDSEIAAIDSCNGTDISYTKLEDLFAYIASNCPEKKVVIDLKGWFPCTLGQLDVDGMMRLEAELVGKLAEKYNIAKNVLLETETLTTLLWSKKKCPEVKTFLTSFGEMERGMLFALKYNLTGVSLKAKVKDEPTREYSELFHKKGLKLMVWNIGPNTDTAKYFNLGADYIQYDF